MATEKQREANRRNRAKRRRLSEPARERLRAAAIRNRPWEYSTGPKTASGKARSRLNAVGGGEYCAARRAESVWVATIHAFVQALPDALAALAGIPTRLALEDLIRCTARFLHPLPKNLDTDTAVAWLAEHRRIDGNTVDADAQLAEIEAEFQEEQRRAGLPPPSPEDTE